jgi:type III secretion protein S
MQYDAVIRLTSEALMLCLVLTLPAALVSATVGLLVAFFQAITSLQDQSISQGIKLLAVGITIFIAAPWAGSTLMRFSESIFQTIFQ